MKSIQRNKWTYLFFILLLLIGYAYSYQLILFRRPFSVHQWRQCDCLSIALNYYKEGMHFFSPTIHWSGPNGDGKTCTSECPWLYYFVALLWKIFGYHEFIFRLVNISIAFTGLYALFCLSKNILKDGAWALLVSLLLFSSTIFAYYAYNFLADTSALSFAFIAWFFFQKFYSGGKMRFFTISMFFFLIAGLTKISALISFAPIFLAFVLESLNIYKFKTNEKIFSKPLHYIFQFLAVFCIIYGWTIFAIHYNNAHVGGAFSTSILPIWETHSLQNYTILNQLFTEQLPVYLAPFLLIGVLLILVVLFLVYKSVSRFLLFLTCTVLMACIAYIILWFQVFYVHDYYLINLLILVPLILLTFLDYLKKKQVEIFISVKVKVIGFIALLLSIYYCSVQINMRYSPDYPVAEYNIAMDGMHQGYWNYMDASYKQGFQAFETITPYLRSLGIKREDKVISIPDQSINISLYLMDQKGYTDYGQDESNNQMSIKKCMELGAKYLIINDTSFISKEWLSPFLTKKIGRYKNILIYDLRN